MACWATLTPAGTAEHEVAIFSSGIGDGVYPTYWGYDQSGSLCCLSTDFGMFHPDW